MKIIESGENSDTVSIIENNYIEKASPGLKTYTARFDVTAATIASSIASRPALYEDIDHLIHTILEQEDELRSGFRQLLVLFPRAAFPPVWFLVGGHGPRGQAAMEGALIGSEGLSNQPERIAPLVLHELAHFQSAMVQGLETYQRIYGPEQTLLALALREGSAELIAKLTTGNHTNPAAEEYGLAHEKELWGKFRLDMQNRDPGDWMFTRPANPDWPSDLGYWMGYRIVKCYYDQAENKHQAIFDILNLRDFMTFLQKSRYAGNGQCL